MSYTDNSDNTLLKLNIDTKVPLIPSDFQLWVSRLEAKYTSRLNFFCTTQPSNKFSNKVLGPYEILATTWHPFCHPRPGCFVAFWGEFCEEMPCGLNWECVSMPFECILAKT